MLLSPDEGLIVSSVGWCDGGSLWTLETSSVDVSTCRISDARYLELRSGSAGYFSIVHHHGGERIRISVHSFADPPVALAQLTVDAAGGVFEGDVTAWSHVARTYVAQLKQMGQFHPYLVMIEAVAPGVEAVRLDWFDDSYDRDYQGVIGVVEVPDREEVIFSVQRDSRPVLYDLAQRKVVSRLSLADRSGNPTLRFTTRSSELWADDYDTILRIDPSTWKVRDKKLLQGARTGCAQFIGDYCFAWDETLCAVARPFAGDVVALDMKRFKITHGCELGRQPLRLAVLADGVVYARDWQTGELLTGRLKRR
jgi:hypothetical protein